MKPRENRVAWAGSAAGFTLVELMVVIAIIGMISSIVALNLTGTQETAKVAKAKADLKQIDSAIILYHSEASEYPSSLADLVHAREGHGALLDGGEAALIDPWKHPYIYSASGDGDAPYVLGSYGKDGNPGGTGFNADIFQRGRP